MKLGIDYFCVGYYDETAYPLTRLCLFSFVASEINPSAIGTITVPRTIGYFGYKHGCQLSFNNRLTKNYYCAPASAS